MIFSTDMIDAILAGRKTRTTRPKRPGAFGWALCRYVVGRTYAVCPGGGKPGVARIRVIAVTEWDHVADIKPQEEHAQREGFATWQDFMARWTHLYGHSPERFHRPVWVIDFELDRSPA